MPRDSSVDGKERVFPANDDRPRDSGVADSGRNLMAGNSWQQLEEDEGRDITDRKTTRSASDSDNGVGDSVAAVRRRSADEMSIEMVATGSKQCSSTPFGSVSGPAETGCGAAEAAREGGIEYKVYKRRWFGLVQLTLLNIIVSFDVSGFVSKPCCVLGHCRPLDQVLVLFVGIQPTANLELGEMTE